MTLDEKKRYWLAHACQWQAIQYVCTSNSMDFRNRGFDVQAYIQQENSANAYLRTRHAIKMYEKLCVES